MGVGLEVGFPNYLITCPWNTGEGPCSVPPSLFRHMLERKVTRERVE